MNRIISDLNVTYSIMGQKLFIDTLCAIREKNTLKQQIRFGRMYMSLMGLSWFQQKSVILYACRHKGHWLTNAYIA